MMLFVYVNIYFTYVWVRVCLSTSHQLINQSFSAASELKDGVCERVSQDGNKVPLRSFYHPHTTGKMCDWIVKCHGFG